MKKQLLILFVLLNATVSYAQLLVGDVSSVPSSSAMLEVKPSTTTNAKGFRLPNLNQSQITGINTPATGLLVADVSNAMMQYYNGTQWLQVPAFSPSVSSTATFTHNATSSNDVLSIQNLGSGRAIFASTQSTNANVAAIYGTIASTTGGNNAAGIYGKNFTTANNSSGSGVLGEHVGKGSGVKGISSGTTGFGVSGFAIGGIGVYGQATNVAGIAGSFENTSGATAGVGVSGTGGIGVLGSAGLPFTVGVKGVSSDGKAVYGTTSIGYAGYFEATGLGEALYTNGTVQFQNNNEADGRVLTSDVLGGAMWQDLPKIAFTAITASSSTIINPASTQTVDFDATDFDTGSNFTIANDRFTCPKTGIYHFDVRIYGQSSTLVFATQYLAIYNSGGTLKTRYTNYLNTNATTSYQQYQQSIDVKMSSTDYAIVQIITQAGQTFTVAAGSNRTTTFSGHYVCGQ